MASPLQIGEQLEGRFTIRAALADRGARAVYFASDAKTGSRCEVHVLAARAPEVARLQFTREAELLGRVNHAGCLATASVGGLADGTLYCVVSERAGIRIADRAATVLPAYHVADVGAQLLSALQHVHGLDWRVGWLTPDQVDERTIEGRLVVRIVRMPTARPSGESGPTPEGLDTQYADPRLSNGEPASVQTDLYAVGRILLQLASGALSFPIPHRTAAERELAALVGRLSAPTGLGFASAGEAAAAFDDLCAAAVGPVPAVPPAPRTERSSRFRTSDLSIVHALADVAVLADGDALAGGGVPVSAEPAPVAAKDPRESDPMGRLVPSDRHLDLPIRGASHRRRGAWVAVACGAAVVLAATAFVLRPSPESVSASTSVASAAQATAGSVAVLGAAPMDASPAPLAAVNAGNPAHAIAVLNRTDLRRVLPFAERHALLEQMAARPAMHARVDERWNRLLDLAQAADAPTPCATFRAALPELETAAQTPAEETLVASIRVPSPATMLGAGMAPDGNCDGLRETFEALTAPPPAAAQERRSSSSSKAKSKHNTRAVVVEEAAIAEPVAAPPGATKPAKTTNRPNSVATRLDDDVKGVGF